LATNQKYSDLDLDFTRNPITNDVSLKYDAEAVKRSMRNLLLTGRNERLFQPEIEAGIRNLLFENFGSIQLVTLANRIEELLVNNEPRLHEISVEVVNQEDNNNVRIRIYFRVRNLPIVQTLEVDLQRVR
jgi:phage baseplate assembly protein W